VENIAVFHRPAVYPQLIVNCPQVFHSLSTGSPHLVHGYVALESLIIYVWIKKWRHFWQITSADHFCRSMIRCWRDLRLSAGAQSDDGSHPRGTWGRHIPQGFSTGCAQGSIGMPGAVDHDLIYLFVFVRFRPAVSEPGSGSSAQ